MSCKSFPKIEKKKKSFFSVTHAASIVILFTMYTTAAQVIALNRPLDKLCTPYQLDNTTPVIYDTQDMLRGNHDSNNGDEGYAYWSELDMNDMDIKQFLSLGK